MFGLSKMFATDPPPTEDPEVPSPPAFEIEGNAATPVGAPEAESAETSFADLMGDEPPESPAPAAAPPRVPAAARPPAPPPAVPDFASASLVAPPPSRAVRIPLMTPVRKRRGLHAPSVLTGLAVGVAVVAFGIGGWLYIQARPAEGPRMAA